MDITSFDDIYQTRGYLVTKDRKGRIVPLDSIEVDNDRWTPQSVASSTPSCYRYPSCNATEAYRRNTSFSVEELKTPGMLIAIKSFAVFGVISFGWALLLILNTIPQ